MNVTQSMGGGYASPCWVLQVRPTSLSLCSLPRRSLTVATVLQWLDVLRDEGLYLSRGLLRNALHMCAERRDVYGLLEVRDSEPYFAFTHARLSPLRSPSLSLSLSLCLCLCLCLPLCLPLWLPLWLPRPRRPLSLMCVCV